jgi:beta-xylosidase
MPDGRLYLYGSWDHPYSDDYCGRVAHCFSTDDMVHFVDHGIIFRNDEEFQGMPWNSKSSLYAPDAIHRDGKYYYYVCGNHNEEGVAVADSPIGPFSPAEPIVGADGDSIDPSIFVDDDGQAYYFWGQFTLRGGKLADDMKTLIPETIKRGIVTEWEHGFHEGASIRKRNGKYYMVYTDISRGKATCMSYAIADYPLGPYKKGGVIVDNIYCDPSTWNDHGSICEFKGQWYVFYHRSSQNRNTCRRVCAEPIFFDENGYIKEVEMTSSGAEYALNPFNGIPARAACRMMGNCFVTLEDDREVLVKQSGGHWMTDWAEYKYLDFADGATTLTVTVKGKGRISFRTDGTDILGSVDFDTHEVKEYTATVSTVAGRRPLWLFLDGEFTLYSIRAEK